MTHHPTRSHSTGGPHTNSTDRITAFDPAPGRRRRLALAVGTAVALTFAAASCGSDDDDTAATTASTTASTVSSTVAPTEAPASTDPATTEPATSGAADSTAASSEFDAVAYCAAEVELERTGSALGDPSTDPVAAATALLAAAEPTAALAPPELQESYDAALATLQEVIDTGNAELLDSIDRATVHEYDAANCGWNTVAVEMTNYHFSGIPDTLPAGDYNFEVVNPSPEPHVLVIVERNEGVTETFEELLSSPDGESKVTTVAGAFAVPGGDGYGVTHLDPGEYLVLCPILEGGTPTSEGDGPPHFVLGMQQVITVTEA